MQKITCNLSLLFCLALLTLLIPGNPVVAWLKEKHSENSWFPVMAGVGSIIAIMAIGSLLDSIFDQKK